MGRQVTVSTALNTEQPQIHPLFRDSAVNPGTSAWAAKLQAQGDTLPELTALVLLRIARHGEIT